MQNNTGQNSVYDEGSWQVLFGFEHVMYTELRLCLLITEFVEAVVPAVVITWKCSSSLGGTLTWFHALSSKTQMTSLHLPSCEVLLHILAVTDFVSHAWGHQQLHRTKNAQRVEAGCRHKF